MVCASRLIALVLLALAPVLLIGSFPAEAGSAKVGGSRLSCRAASVVVSSKVPGPGYASSGVIYLGTKYLANYPSVTQRLVFLHECGHQYVGTDENAADCWAIRSAKRQGWLTAAGVRATCRAIWDTQGGDNHLPGPERCAAMQQCFADAPGPGGGSEKAGRKHRKG